MAPQAARSLKSVAWMVVAAIIAIALGWFHYARGNAAFDDAANEHHWIEAARPEVSLWQRVQLPFQDRSGVIQLVGPTAIDTLARRPLAIQTLADAQHASTTFNEIALGCELVATRRQLSACSSGATSTRFVLIDDNLERSAAGSDYFVRVADRRLELAQKTQFASAVCNLYPSEAAVELIVRYDPSDRLAEQRINRQIAAGACERPFTRKLRRAPLITAVARATPYRPGVSNPSPLEWRETLALSSTSPEATLALADRSLCYTRPDATCGGQRVNNPARYARALAASLANDEEYQVYGSFPSFPFQIGITIRQAGNRDELGVIIEAVDAGSPADAVGLRAGDRILAVGEVVTFTIADVQLAVNRHGRHNRLQLPVSIEVSRGGDILRGSVALAANRDYWEALGYGPFWTGFRAFLDNLSLGLAPRIACGFGGRSPILGPPGSPPVTGDTCILQQHIIGDALAMLYPTSHMIGSLAGSAVSPLSLILPRTAFVPGMIRSAMARRIIQGTVVNVIENTVATFALADPGDTIDDILGRVTLAMPRAAAVGAASSILPVP